MNILYRSIYNYISLYIIKYIIIIHNHIQNYLKIFKLEIKIIKNRIKKV